MPNKKHDRGRGMRKKISFLSISALVLLNIQCVTSAQVSDENHGQKNQYKEIYVNQFKLVYFKELLRKGFNNTDAVNNLLSSDHSGFTEPILTDDDFRVIDSLVEKDNLMMVKDSINRAGRVAEGAEGKHVLQVILDRIQNNSLDVLAKKRYRIARHSKTSQLL